MRTLNKQEKMKQEIAGLNTDLTDYLDEFNRWQHERRKGN